MIGFAAPGLPLTHSTHVAAEDSADRVPREHHCDVVRVALLVERGRGVGGVRERRVAEMPGLRRWFLGPVVDSGTPGRIVHDDARAGEVDSSSGRRVAGGGLGQQQDRDGREAEEGVQRHGWLQPAQHPQGARSSRP